MKRIAILLMVLVLMVALGFFGSARLDAATARAFDSPAIGAQPLGGAIIGAPNLPELILCGRAQIDGGAVSPRGALRPACGSTLRADRVSVPRRGVRQVILARIRD